MLEKAILLKPHIVQIMKLASDVNRAREVLERQFGTTVVFGSAEAMAMREAYKNDPAYNQAQNSLTGYVESNLTDEQMDIIRAIMYIGRDEQSFLNEDENNISSDKLLKVHYNNIKGEPKQRSIKHMMEKVPLPEYLSNGMKILHL